MNLYDKSSVRKEQSQNPSGRNELRGPKEAGLWVGPGQRSAQGMTRVEVNQQKGASLQQVCSPAGDKRLEHGSRDLSNS